MSLKINSSHQKLVIKNKTMLSIYIFTVVSTAFGYTCVFIFVDLHAFFSFAVFSADELPPFPVFWPLIDVCKV